MTAQSRLDGLVTVAAAPGCTPRLLRMDPEVEDLAAYRAAGGYRTVDSVERFLDEVRLSGLLGRGGAAFPMAVKLSGVRDAHRAGAETIAVANGEEGEPSSIKDKWLMRHRPHLVLDGLRLAAAAAGARRAYVYLSDPVSARSIDTALSELDRAEIVSAPVELVVVTPAYIAGEETAAVRAINGGPAKPSDKPPRPFQQGVAGAPTVISNVETLAHLPFIQRHGGATYRTAGTADSPGTFLTTVTGAGRAPALYELPYGTSFDELLTLHGVTPGAVRGALMGGYFTGMVDQEVLGATLDHQSIRRLGADLGCGAISLITDECPVAVTAAVLSYFDRENAGQCGSCFNGTAAMRAAAVALRDGDASPTDVARLERWSVVLRGRGACGTLDGAANAAATLLARFGSIVTAHLENRCPTCAQHLYVAERPFEAEAVVYS